MLALEQLYEREYDRWLSETIELLKNRQFDRVDYEHLIEELAALGRSEKTAVKSLSLQIIIQLLLYQFWTTEREKNSNHWAAEIITFRVQLEYKLTTNLSKFLELELELENIYENARLIAEKKTGLKNLPIICPYSLRQILEKQWFPDTDNQ
ncbi:DUF29 domain-containing protein [Microcystis aeruginosa]|uniref:DUF29 domain-containing protein n=1 Tax=Microcystis aeruginosa PCC 9808 TaxID=1160284 RepID=I4I353_MICAE|nr:DUF29 domain-containing protein [Microcystis aeruginosa]CCI28727.1 conserved hypothetical protein [Microcystis aeruginosa PCC 9808]